MAFIEWDPSFSVGSAKLDADHQKLLGMLNDIYEAWMSQAGSEVLNRLFDELIDYTDTHFSREEAMLTSRGFHDLPAHRGEHAKLRARVLQFRARHLSGVAPDALTEEIARFLKSWMMDHILGEDMQYRTVFTGE